MHMVQKIRPAQENDVPQLVELLMADAVQRHAKDATLWKIADDASAQIEEALAFALTAENQPFRQFWQVAEERGQITGVVHSMMLPVPPIYAGANGEPGLIHSDSSVAPNAPAQTVGALLDAAEDALRDAGARVILSSYVAGEEWRTVFGSRGFDPLTLYLSITGLEDQGMPPGIRQAKAHDIPGIVARSAENRQCLYDIDVFWEGHPEADARFSAWMTRSLTLRDRDMLVVGASEDLEGYVIAQPASRLHFPPAHDISGTGVIDDYFHRELADRTTLINRGENATALLRAAETAFARRGIGAALVVCPAGWQSKIELLEAAGYETAMVWCIKR